MLPLLSNAYIPTEGLPGWLRTVAEWNPISAVATALRDLFGNAPVPEGAAWPVAHPVAGALLWCAVLLGVFVPLAVRRYAHGGRYGAAGGTAGRGEGGTGTADACGRRRAHGRGRTRTRPGRRRGRGGVQRTEEPGRGTALGLHTGRCCVPWG
ncbi:hypothetical protein SCYAM73S_03334 [Streptomyces cyaneofuscatus]